MWWRGVAGALVGAAAVGAIVVGVGSGGLPADAWSLGDGMAWVPASATGELVLLDGTTGRLASRVDGVGTGDLDTALHGGNALVVNPDREALFRVDGATQSLARLGANGEAGVRFEGAQRVLVGGDVAYVVQPGRQRVQPVDPVSLRALGDPVSFVGSDFDAAADDDGVLWLLDREVGRLQAVEGSRLRLSVDLGWRNHDASVVLVDGTPVVVNRTSGSVTVIDPYDGRLDERSECPWFRAGDSGVRVAGSPSGPSWLTVAVPGAGSVLVAPLGSTKCPTPIAVADPGAVFGVPVATEGLVYLPVISTGRVVVVDPNRGAAVAEAQVVDQPGTQFELVVDDGLVFFNAPFSHEAGTVSPDADVSRIDKSHTGASGGGDDGDTDGDAACRVSAQQARPGEPVSFTVDNQQQPFTDIEWGFGDGTQATGTPVEHAYTEPGRYEPSVTIAGVVSPCPAITVGDPAGLQPKIEGPSQVQVGQTVTYRDATDADITSRQWNLPGGTPPTSDAPQVQVRFDTPGTQVIELTVHGPTGTATARARIEITTQPPPTTPNDGNSGTSPTTPIPTPPPTPSPGPTTPPPSPPSTTPDCGTPAATLTGTAEIIQEGGSVQFDLTFSQDADACAVIGTEWLVDGTPVASGAPTLTHVFESAGTFEVATRFTYRTPQGSEAVGVPTPAALTMTVEPPPPVNPFVGDWLTDSNGHLDITERSSTELDVHVFGSCSPTPCDVGGRIGTIAGPRTATLDFDDGVARNQVTLQVDPGGQHLDSHWTFTFHPGDPRGVNCVTQRYRLGSAGDPFVRDNDCDDVPEGVDNCPGPFEGDNAATFNPDQADSDGDGIGDVCDP